MARFRQMKSTVNYYLTSLAIADLMTLITGGIEKLIPYYTTGIYPLLPRGMNRFHCSFTYIIIDALFNTSLLHIMWVTLEIFYALCKPLVHRRISSNRRTFGLIFLSWFVGLILGFAANFPLWMKIKYVCVIWRGKSPYIQKYPMIVGDCYLSNDTYTLIRIIIKCVGFLVSLVVNCALYILILYTLKKKQSNKIRQTSMGHLKAVCKMIIIKGDLRTICRFSYIKVYKLITLGTKFKTLVSLGRKITMFSKFITNYIEQG